MTSPYPNIDMTYRPLTTAKTGKFTKVCQCLNIKDNLIYAVKYLEVAHDWRKEMTNKDFTLSSELDSPYIMKVHSFQEKGTYHDSTIHSYPIVYNVLEYCTGDLLGLILNCSAFKENIAFKFFVMIIKALQHMHSKGISHQDLKAERCYITENYQIKIGGFMFGTKNVKITDEFGGTIPYLSPEKLGGIPYNPFDVDIFSCGVILYMMVTEYMPFKLARADDEFYKHFYLNKNDFWSTHKGTEGLSASLKNLIEGMLEPNPQLRIKLSDILEHSWYNEQLSTMLSDEAFVKEINKVHK